MQEFPRIICVSNRLPLSATEDSGKLEFIPSSGGLVSAMGPILRKSQGIWLGWPGQLAKSEEEIAEALTKFSADSEFDLYPVILDQQAVDGFYNGFSNSIIWPLFHDLQSRCKFEAGYWSTYLEVQQRFREQVLKVVRADDLIWVHDYHLMGLGQELRNLGIKNKICFFLHTPFPAPDIFYKLPWSKDVINSMLSYNLIGFQTNNDLKNFVECYDLYAEKKSVPTGNFYNIKSADGQTLAGSFPISVDFQELEVIANSQVVEEAMNKLRADINVDYLVLSIDRLDYTKGIPYRIKAFGKLLEMEPDLKKRIVLLQIVVPSRVEVEEYQQLKLEIEQLVTNVNGELGEPGWMPVQHIFRSFTREEVLAMYRASDVALVTPLKDGMNLVAKEFCVSHVNNEGTLVLSEFAGAAKELKDFAFLVNPYDVNGIAVALKQAIESSDFDTNQRMQRAREQIKNADVFNWASSFLRAIGWEWSSMERPPRPRTKWEHLIKISRVFDI